MTMNQTPFMKLPSSVDRTPAAIRPKEITVPALLAHRVAFSMFPLRAQRVARSTRPPSSGKPGSRLKTPRLTVKGDPDWAMKMAFTRQPPRIALVATPLPLKNGNW